MNTRPAEQRFWEKVSKSLGCWEWSGAINAGGYGNFRFLGRVCSAHRAVFLVSGLSIPDGMTVDHLCRNRRCVNPLHLEFVSLRTNILRGVGATARNARKKVCPVGHFLMGKNLYQHKDGRRECRACILNRGREWKRANRRKQGIKERRFKNR